MTRAASPVHRDATVLGFDTSGGWCCAAVVRGGTVLAHRHIDMTRGQGEALMPLLNATLGEAGLGWGDLTALGVGTGPGNFTGIRISVAAARGLALGLGVEAIGVTRFEALALDGPAVPTVVPALRGQVWVQQPGCTPDLADTPPAQAIGEGFAIGDGLTPPAHPLAVAIARIASDRIGSGQPRPAPLYLRDADAAPPSERPPELIP